MKRFFISLGLLLLVVCLAGVIVLFSVYQWAEAYKTLADLLNAIE